MLPYRVRLLGGGLELDFPGQPVAVPTASREVGALVLLALNPGRELALDAFKIALYDCDPGLVSNAAIQTPVSRLRKAGVPIPAGGHGYVLEVGPSEVDIVDFDARSRAFIEAVASPHRLDEEQAVELLRTGTELYELWQHDPAAAVGHDPMQSTLFESHRRRHRRFGMAFARLLATTRDTGKALELLDDYVDRYGEEAGWTELRAGLAQPSATRFGGGASLGQRDRQAAAVHGANQAPGSPVVPTASDDTVGWPVQVGRPPVRPGAFQSREALAGEIASGMASEGSTVLAQIVAAGGGGVGKTQLAAAAFSSARDEGVDLLVWVNASSRESIVTTYAQARSEIDPGTVSGGSAEDAALAFLSWLGSTRRSWLVVLDDVADPAHVRGLWPEGRTGRVVATTRRRDLAPAGAQQVLVGVFTPEEAHGYLRERLAGSLAQPAHPQALDEAAKLAEDLGWLPVALAQAGAVILNEGITCAEYRRRFADQAASLDRLFPADAGADDYAHTVATTWSLAVDQADRLPPEGLARPALHLAAVLDPNGAPDVLWTASPVLRYLGSHLGIEGSGAVAGEAGTAGAAASGSPSLTGDVEPGADAGLVPADQARAALRNLHRFNLVDHDPAGGALAVRAHALVQRATLEPLTVEERAEAVRVAADALAEIWPATESDAGRARAFRQNVATLAGRVEDVLWQPEAHEVLFRAGRSLGELGLVHEPLGYWTEMEATGTRLLGADHPQTLTVRHDLADARGVAGDRKGAVAAFESLLADCVRALGSDHPATLGARNDLADWRGASGDAEGAVQALEGLLSDRLRTLGPDHPDTLTTRHDLTYWRGAAGDAGAAVEGFEELLADRLRVLGPDHRDTLFTRYRLANWRGLAGDAGAAVEGFEELLADRLRVLGPDHPETLFTRHNVARWGGVAGDRVDAIEMLAELLDDQLKVLGPDHPDTLTTRAGLAHWRGVAGDPAAALAGLEELLADTLRVFGPNQDRTFFIRQDLADWQGIAGEGAIAVEMLAKLRDDQVEGLGPDSLHTLATRHDLAYWQGVVGDSVAALAGFKNLVGDRLRVLGPNHQHTLAAQRDLAHWQRVTEGYRDSAPDNEGRAGLDEPHSHPPGLLPLCTWRCGGRGPRIRRPVRRPSAWTAAAIRAERPDE